MRPDIDLTFIESSEKKLNFVKGACEKIGIDAAFLNGRAEEIAASGNREVFDVAVSRAGCFASDAFRAARRLC